MEERKKLDVEIEKLFKQNLSNSEIAEKLNIGVGRVKSGLGRLGLKRTKGENRAILSRRLKESYRSGISKPLKGRSNPFTRPEVKQKIKEYNLAHAEELKAKREATCLKKYGVKNVFELKEVQDKIKQINLQRYGYTSPMKNTQVREKTSKTSRKNLAIKYNHKELAQRIKNKSLELDRPLKPSELIEISERAQSNAYLLMHKYNLEKYVALEKCEFEEDIIQILEKYNIQYERRNRQIIKPKEIDIYIPEYNLGIEANDVNTHNSTKCCYRGGRPKSKSYHYYKSLRCEEKGMRLIHIWDYEWYEEKKRPILESIILGACNRAKPIYARKCKVVVKSSKEVKEFFEKNNIAGHRGGKFAICLEYEGEIVMSYIMGSAFFGKGKYEWEVIRGATKLGYRVIGGASKIWKYFIRNYNPKSCVYYVDYNYFNGNSVPKLGFKYVGVRPTVKNYFVKEGKITSRQPAKHKEIKELIKQKKVWEVWTAGVKVYVWENPNLL